MEGELKLVADKQQCDKKKQQLKKRLLLHTDEDSDSSGEETTNPVALGDTEAGKYVPPSLPLAAINDS